MSSSINNDNSSSAVREQNLFQIANFDSQSPVDPHQRLNMSTMALIGMATTQTVNNMNLFKHIKQAH